MATQQADPLADFESGSFAFDGKDRSVYRLGDGPGVVIMAEVPGITPRVADFARRVAGEGLTAVLPHLFGTPGAPPSAGTYLRTIGPLCVSKEFAMFAKRTTPPAIDWLRALCRETHERCGGPGVGAVGMCFTGGFALAMATEPALLAPVLSQPSLPVGRSRAARSDLGLSDADLLTVRERAAEDDLCVLGLRFSGDALSPPERFASLRRELGDNFIGVELDSSAGNPDGHRTKAHSVLTEDLDDRPGTPTHDALEQVLTFLIERLRP
ncbi:MAG: dienelactone hydrolase [Actinobacteria bacterium]|nr:dienelactone hydrolase [Actinomycetota bacterium]